MKRKSEMNQGQAVLSFLLFFVLSSHLAMAQTEPRSSDKLDVQKLEEKYWSVKDDDFTVVQNRAYPKKERFYASLGAGKLINDGYSDGTPSAAAFGYYFTERWGLELNYQSISTKNNQVTDGFLKQNGASPNFNRPVSTLSLSGIWVPFYAKVSFLEKSILYFDMSLALHLGMADYLQERNEGGVKKSAFQYGLDITQTFFLNRDWAIRFDFRNRWSSQELIRYYQSGVSQESRELPAQNTQDTSMLLGITRFF